MCLFVSNLEFESHVLSQGDFIDITITKNVNMTVETKICILNKRVAGLVVYLLFWSNTRLRNQAVGILRGKENDMATYGESGGPTSPAGPTEPIVSSMYVHASCCILTITQLSSCIVEEYTSSLKLQCWNKYMSVDL